LRSQGIEKCKQCEYRKNCRYIKGSNERQCPFEPDGGTGDKMKGVQKK